MACVFKWTLWLWREEWIIGEREGKLKNHKEAREAAGDSSSGGKGYLEYMPNNSKSKYHSSFCLFTEVQIGTDGGTFLISNITAT